jgi:hypothetical protein
VAALSTVIPGCSPTTANLCAAPAADLPDLAAVAADADTWLQSRKNLRTALGDCDEVMAAWGLSDLTGPARRHRQDQLRWLRAAAAGSGHTSVWTVGGGPRHPSRWHQYVSDKYGRTTGGGFEERLEQVLMRVPLQSLVQ